LVRIIMAIYIVTIPIIIYICDYIGIEEKFKEAEEYIDFN